MQVVLEIPRGTGFWQYGLDNMLVVLEYLVERVWLEIIAGFQVKEFPKRETSQVVTLHDAVQFRILLFQPHYARPREYYLQLRIFVIACSQFLAPVGIFKYLVYQQHSTAIFHEISSEFRNAFALEVEVVHVGIETFSVIRTKFLFRVL